MFKIVCHPEYSDRKRRMIYGKIHVTARNFVFPRVDWSDNIFPIIAWWIREIDGYAYGGHEEIRLAFMEGPFEMCIARHDLSRGSLIKFGENKKTIFETEIEICVFIDHLLDAVVGMNECCVKIPDIALMFPADLIGRLELAKERIKIMRCPGE